MFTPGSKVGRKRSSLINLGSLTKAQLNTLVTDGDPLYVGDVTQYTDEMARDAIGAALVAGTNITITVADGANTITIEATGGGGIWGPVVDGSFPPVFIQNPDGSLVLAEYV